MFQQIEFRSLTTFLEYEGNLSTKQAAEKQLCAFTV